MSKIKERIVDTGKILFIVCTLLLIFGMCWLHTENQNLQKENERVKTEFKLIQKEAMKYCPKITPRDSIGVWNGKVVYWKIE